MIKIDQLRKIYNKGKRNQVDALKGVSLELGETGLCAIYGKSGSGKTTLMNMIGGLDSFDGGTITADEHQYAHAVDDKYRIENIGYIFQNYLLDEKVNVYENVARSLRTIGVKDEEKIFRRVMTALRNVDMQKYYLRNVNTLSGGQQQRVAIARAMAKGSKIILADEPTGNLDEQNTAVVMDILKAMSQNCLVILVTHEHNLIERYADRVIKIVDGEVVMQDKQSGTSAEYQDKNLIFLGGKEKGEISLNGITVETYGNVGSVRLRLVEEKGKYYLAAQEDIPLRWVDETSEVKFIETDRKTYLAAEKEKTALSLQVLDRITPEKSGKVFGFRESFKEGMRNVAGRKRKRNRLLSFLIMAFSVTLICMIATIGSGWNLYQKAGDNWDPYKVAVSFHDSDELHEMMELAEQKQYGIFDASTTQIYDYDLENGDKRFSFTSGGFESVGSFNEKFLCATYSKTAISDLKFVCGGPSDARSDIYVSKPLAEKLLAQMRQSMLIDNLTYQDLMLNEVSYSLYYDEVESLRIAGVVEWDRPCLMIDDMIRQEESYYQMFGVKRAEKYGLHPAPDEVWIPEQYAAGNNDYKEGAKLEIGQKFFTIRLFDREDLSGKYLSDEAIATLKFDLSYAADYFNVIFQTTTPDALAEYLDTAFPNSRILTKETQIARSQQTENETMLTYGVTALAIGGFMFLGMYLLVYSTMVSRIKEIGIYRATGVSKSNICLKFFYESLALVLFSVAIGFLLIGLPIMIVSQFGISGMPVYLTWWMFLLSFVGIVGLMMLACMLPVWMFLSKTPIEILSRYDL